MIGGIEPARSLILTALKSGKPVVTANKELLANHGGEIFATAETSGVDVLFEAAVGGGTPVLSPLAEDLAARRGEASAARAEIGRAEGELETAGEVAGRPTMPAHLPGPRGAGLPVVDIVGSTLDGAQLSISPAMGWRSLSV